AEKKILGVFLVPTEDVGDDEQQSDGSADENRVKRAEGTAELLEDRIFDEVFPLILQGTGHEFCFLVVLSEAKDLVRSIR
ncbi:MAG TPA: hypothetical protein PKZ07_08890, partial [Sedimentisphaerales bacterium]|nr:hypothetical protein [Sedimentisphaerales bacterium]